MKNLPILLKRESWENPSFYIAPLIVMAIIILGALGGLVQGVGGTIGFKNLVTTLEVVAEAGRSGVIYATFIGIALTFLTVQAFIIFFYLLDALYSERKQRHILFWKSLPITNTETVLSKVITATFVIPLFFLLGIFITKIIFLAISSIFIWVGGGSALDLLWKPAPLFSDLGVSLYGIVTAGMWMLPFTGWFLLLSSLTKRAHPFIWAVLIPIFIGIVEKLTFGTEKFVNTIGEYLTMYFPIAFGLDDQDVDLEIKITNVEDLNRLNFDDFSFNSLTNSFEFISSPQLWIGMTIGVVFIVSAIYVRRYRDDT